MTENSEQPRIVAIETTGRQGSVAISAGDDVAETIRFAADMRHAAELLPAIDRLCSSIGWQPDDLDEVYVSAGPGSFTGCRIGVTVARALAQAVGVKLVRVPTVDVLARNALSRTPPPEHLVVLLDAQRRQLYAAFFDLVGGEYVRQGEIRVGEPSVLLADRPGPCAALGEGIAYHRQAVMAATGNQGPAGIEILPESIWPAGAEHVLRVGRRLASQGAYVSPGELVPIYIRLPEAEERWQARQGEAAE